MLFDKPLNALKRDARKPTTVLQPDRIEPELRDIVIALDVDMTRFIAVTSIKEEPIRTSRSTVGMPVRYPTAQRWRQPLRPTECLGLGSG